MRVQGGVHVRSSEVESSIRVLAPQSCFNSSIPKRYEWECIIAPGRQDDIEVRVVYVCLRVPVCASDLCLSGCVLTVTLLTFQAAK